jgi:hypothetical protein
MTEPLLFGTTFLAVALVAEWARSIPNAQNLQLEKTERPSLPAGWAMIAAVLTRYEAFPIIAAAIALSFVVLARRGFSLSAAFRAVRGLAMWPAFALLAFSVNSKVSVGAFFVSGGFYVAENPALGTPWLAWTQVWEGLLRLAGPVIPWVAVVSAIAIMATFVLPPKHLRQGYGGPPKRSAKAEGGSDLAISSKHADSSALVLVLALAACAALPLYAYFKGHPVRIRYDVPLVAACAALVGSGVALLPRRLQPVAGAAIVALGAWQVHPLDDTAPVVVESQREAPNMEGRRAVTAYLVQHWDGQPILMSMGSLGHYMHDLSLAGFGIRDFLHEGNGEIWKYAVAHPHPVAEWIAIEERAEGGDALNWQAKHDANFLRGYRRVAEGGGVSLYRRSGDQEVPK